MTFKHNCIKIETMRMWGEKIMLWAKRLYRISRELALITYDIAVDGAEYLRDHWPQIKEFISRRYVYIPFTVFVVLLISWLLLLNLYLADPSRLASSFNTAKENIQTIYEDYRGLPQVSSEFSEESINAFEAESSAFVEESLNKEIDTPIGYFLNHALRDFSDREDELAKLENNDADELITDLKESTSAHTVLFDITWSVLNRTPSEDDSVDFFTDRQSAFEEIRPSLPPREAENVNKVFNKLVAEAQQFEQSGDASRWQAQLKVLKAELRKAAALSWQTTFSENSQDLSEYISDYERMQFLFEKL